MNDIMQQSTKLRPSKRSHTSHISKHKQTDDSHK